VGMMLFAASCSAMCDRPSASVDCAGFAPIQVSKPEQRFLYPGPKDDPHAADVLPPGLAAEMRKTYDAIADHDRHYHEHCIPA
jgi:hypothetical protein